MKKSVLFATTGLSLASIIASMSFWFSQPKQEPHYTLSKDPNSCTYVATYKGFPCTLTFLETNPAYLGAKRIH